MRIDEHQYLNFDRGEKISFYFNGSPIEGYTNESIAAALHAAGIRCFGSSSKEHLPRGLFCAIGDCGSCYMIVDGCPNTRICVTRCHEGMVVEEQNGLGGLKP